MIHKIFTLLVIFLSFGFSQQVSSVITVNVDWTKTISISQTIPTLQLVVNPLIRRGSPIWENTFLYLKKLDTDFSRFVPWLPYPKLAVAELDPPTSNPRCATGSTDQIVHLFCSVGLIEKISFSSYGTPSGRCGSFSEGDCHSVKSEEVVRKLCIGKSECSIPVTVSLFDDPCYGVEKHLSVQAECSISLNHTSWDFHLIDPIMEDFMNATEDHPTVINFSTTPQWMWNTETTVSYNEDADMVQWNYEEGTELRDWSMQELQDYYARVVSWYTKGGFIDEYGVEHRSNHFYRIPIWEILNEIDSEHRMSPAYYTKVYDAIVTGIQQVQPNMKFMGLALAGHNEFDFYQYFLDKRNHQPDIPIDYISFHFYASCQNRNESSEYTSFFSQADTFIKEVKQIEKIRQQLSPETKVDIDEVGAILPSDNDANPGTIPDTYWNAVAAMFAYLFGNFISEGDQVNIIGQSQLVGFPSQFPSVTILDWRNGLPNARYWVLKLLKDNTNVGDQVVVSVSSDRNLFSLAYVTVDNHKKLLLVNKLNQNISVQLNGISNGTIEFSDVNTGFNPPVTQEFSNGDLILGGWSVAIVTLFL